MVMAGEGGCSGREGLHYFFPSVIIIFVKKKKKKKKKKKIVGKTKDKKTLF